jgi:hypothetical protein
MTTGRINRTGQNTDRTLRAGRADPFGSPSEFHRTRNNHWTPTRKAELRHTGLALARSILSYFLHEPSTRCECEAPFRDNAKLANSYRQDTLLRSFASKCCYNDPDFSILRTVRVATTKGRPRDIDCQRLTSQLEFAESQARFRETQPAFPVFSAYAYPFLDKSTISGYDTGF